MGVWLEVPIRSVAYSGRCSSSHCHADRKGYMVGARNHVFSIVVSIAMHSDEGP
jgi:hypothetical protein